MTLLQVSGKRFGLCLIAVFFSFFTLTVQAESASELDREAKTALAKLYQEVPGAKELGKAAKAILVFPTIIKGGLIVGGHYGEGALRQHGKTSATIGSAPPPTGSRPAPRALAMPCFS